MEDRNANLKKLASYLDTLPDDYNRFEMAGFLSYDGTTFGLSYDATTRYLLCELPLNECGSIACAVGHGPNAGICMTPEEAYHESFSSYTRRCFIDTGTREFLWMFGGSWSDADNTAKGAAARIRYYLDRGVPGDFHWPEDFDITRYQEYRK